MKGDRLHESLREIDELTPPRSLFVYQKERKKGN